PSGSGGGGDRGQRRRHRRAAHRLGPRGLRQPCTTATDVIGWVGGWPPREPWKAPSRRGWGDDGALTHSGPGPGSPSSARRRRRWGPVQGKRPFGARTAVAVARDPTGGG